MAYTTGKLTEILLDEFERCTSIISDKPHHLRTAFDLEQDAIACKAYQEVTRQVWHYQIHHQVSGLIWCEYEYRGHTIQFPKKHGQLITISSDIKILKAYKNRVVEWWLNVIGGKTIWCTYSDEHEVISSTDHALRVARDVDWAIPLIDDFPVPRITLSLEWGIPEDVDQLHKPTSGRVSFSGLA
jgi:hypothetical protein